MKNFKTLEVGKTYRAINGGEITITYRNNDNSEYQFKGNDDCWYTKEGDFFIGISPHPFDLIELIEFKDIETDTVIDVNGVLSSVLTDSDKLKIESKKKEILNLIENVVKQYYNTSETMSGKMAALDMMNELKIKGIQHFIDDFTKAL